MYEDSSICVIVPAYNEEEFIGRVIDRVPDYVDTLVVVDDNSDDQTLEEAYARTSEPASEPPPDAITDGGALATPRGEATETQQSTFDGRTVIVRHTTNRGRGGAIKTGYRIALTMGHDVVAVIDGDGQMDPQILDRFVDPIVDGRADYAKGDRLVSSNHTEDMSRWRLFGNTILTFLTRIASGKWKVRDPQNGYTAIAADALEQLAIEELYDDYGFLNDLLIRLDVNDLDVVDVPMEAVYGDETSYIRYRYFIPNLSLLLFKGFLWRFWYKHLAVSA